MKEIDIKDYFIEIIDDGRATIGYDCVQYKIKELVHKIYKQNDELKRLEQENSLIGYNLGLKEKENEELKTENEKLKEENEELKTLFNDDYFQGLDIKTVIELAKKSIRMTAYNRELENTLEEIKEKWNEFKELSPLEISFKQKQVYELDKAINNEVLK